MTEDRIREIVREEIAKTHRPSQPISRISASEGARLVKTAVCGRG